MIEDLYSKYLSCDCRITTDSREVNGGEMFFALKGEKFDGNKYAFQALDKGALWAVVNESAELPEDSRLIRVPDTFTSLQELAVHHRTHVCSGKLPVIGLTGTNGKTTTKNLVSAVLERKFRVVATKGNFNNDIGVPLSLLQIRPDTQIAVIEMGANHPDDIARLVKVCQPDYGLITNVGKAHLLGFGSFEGVRRAKGELYNWLGSHEGSVIFLNEDDPVLRQMASRQSCHCFGYGVAYQDVELLETTPESPFLRLRLDGSIVSTNLVGAYNTTNVLAAIAVGDYFGVPRAESIAAVESFVPSNNRSQMMRTANSTLVVDAYNANPSSMAAAISNFALMTATDKTALLGEMRELGADSVQEHVAVIKRLREASIPACLVGEEFRKALEVVEKGSELWFETSADLSDYLLKNPLVKGSLVLVKGSRGIEMEKVLPSL